MNKSIILMTLLCLGNNLKPAAGSTEIDIKTERKEVALFLNELKSLESSGYDFHFTNSLDSLCSTQAKSITAVKEKHESITINFPTLNDFSRVELKIQLASVLTKTKANKDPYGKRTVLGEDKGYTNKSFAERHFRSLAWAENFDDLLTLMEAAAKHRHSFSQIFGGPAFRAETLSSKRGIRS